MTTEPIAQAPSMPEWLVAAEKAREEERERRRAADRAARVQQAEAIRERLAELGVEPIQPARVDRHGWLVPAYLAPEDMDTEQYAVFAGYDPTHGPVVLAGHSPTFLENGRLPAQQGRPLCSVTDILVVREEGPVTGPAPEPDWPGRASSLFTMDKRADSADANAIVLAIEGLAAAVLARPSAPAQASGGLDVDLDCEFLPGDLTARGLLSIGLSAGPGHTYYAVNAEMDTAAVLRRSWMREHVWPHLPLTAEGALNRSHPDVKSYHQIRDEVAAFFAELGDNVTLWTYCGAQDVVRLHSLWGNDWSVMPDSVPQWADDLARLRRDAGGAPLPAHTGRQHHALDDAEHQRRARAYFRSLTG
ncbi:hypothetical protein SAM9427_37135 (plasmid) [Streptomyces sp. ETH9427]|uniref:3'-5' exoribonuclease n=1 Tax=Streptomyces sp. E1N211 TaxID=1851876 RepID=UPI000E0A823C|nr:3'-5' exoribonuclease [Streptomyces sp. E1N211]AXI91394.1 hypothetical protein SAM9427_37135 [Streptomyces sp. ETH9427]